jgi:hypothetical protein
MKNKILMIALIGSALSGLDAAACTDYTKEECRLQFTEQNMPHPVPPNPLDPSLKTIRDALTTAHAAGEKKAKILTSLDSEKDIDKILLLYKALKVAQDQQKKEMDIAIALTIETYQLSPGVKVAPVHIASPETRQPIDVLPWRPHYSENVTPDEKHPGHFRLLNDQEQMDLAVKSGDRPGFREDYRGGTDRDNGSIGMFPSASRDPKLDPNKDPEAFSDPGRLASTIYHETTHWLDDAAAGASPTPKEDFLSEQRAYTREAAQKAVFGFSDDDVESLKRKAALYGAQAQQVGGMTWGEVQDKFHKFLPAESFPGRADKETGASGNPEPIKDVGDQNFFEGLEQLRSISHEAKQMTEAAEKRDAELAEQRRQEMKAQQAALEAANAQRYHAVLDYLDALSTLACSDPQSFQAQIDQRHFIDAMTSLEYMSGYRNYNPRNCKDFVLDKIGNANAPVSPTWVLAWAKKYHADHPGFWEQVGNALNNFFAAMNEVESQSSSNSGGGSTANNTPTRNPPQRNDPPAQPQGGGNVWHGSGALSQLGGIGGGF